MAKPFAVLVTGGAGYIGAHAALALTDAGWPVVVLDDLSTGRRDAVPAAAAFVAGDVADGALVERTCRDHQVGAVMHFAGSIVVPESVGDPLKYYRNNTAATRTLIEAVVRAGVARFIFSSTAAVYGVPDAVPIAEEARLAPINPYGRSKLMTEWMLADVAAAHGLGYVALRYFNVAGADPAGRAGQSGANATHLVKIAVEAVTGKRGHVAVFGTDYDTPDGTCIRDYIHVSDLADAHLAALDHLVAQPDAQLRMNCGYERGFSVLEVLDAVDSVTGTPVTRRMEPRRPGDPDRLVADSRRLQALTGWTPKRDHLPTIIADALAWERKLAAQ